MKSKILGLFFSLSIFVYGTENEDFDSDQNIYITDEPNKTITDEGEIYFKGDNVEWKSNAKIHIEIGATESTTQPTTVQTKEDTPPTTQSTPTSKRKVIEDANLWSYEYPLCEGSMFVEGQFLYWKPKVPIVWATRAENIQAQNPDLPSSFSNDIVVGTVDMKAHAGYRLQLGFYLPPEGWTTYFQYTQFMARGSNSLDELGDPDRYSLNIIWQSLNPTENGAGGGPEAGSATQKIRLKLLDWVMERSLFWWSKFSFSPFFGLRYGWIKNDLNILGSQLNVASGLFGTDSIDVNNHFKAFGLLTGFKANWLLGYGFEIFGNLTLSGIWGRYDLTHKEAYHFVNSSDPLIVPYIATNHKKLYMAKPIFEFLFGINWGKTIKDEKMHIGLKAGYEISIYPSQIQISRSGASALPNNVDQTIHGLTTAARLDF
ncbi:MAG: Lpg1974 family pore-forming outer membrane protein [Chlamydiota bacterium]|jgi:hypothetical protein